MLAVPPAEAADAQPVAADDLQADPLRRAAHGQHRPHPTGTVATDATTAAERRTPIAPAVARACQARAVRPVGRAHLVPEPAGIKQTAAAPCPSSAFVSRGRAHATCRCATLRGPRATSRQNSLCSSSSVNSCRKPQGPVTDHVDLALLAGSILIVASALYLYGTPCRPSPSDARRWGRRRVPANAEPVLPASGPRAVASRRLNR